MKDLLRFCTSGSVDDGKSTLLGRLLFETGRIPKDQFKAIEQVSIRRGKKEVDFSLLLDGLESEREQGITIDVAYRYFETEMRRFIVADTPGHEQYTRNMVTGASNSELAIILIDARNGVQVQSKRHGFINSLLGIPHLVVAVNKMDLVGYSKEIYDKIVKDYSVFSEKLKVQDITFIPISALKGDNVCQFSENMKWYKNTTVLQELENAHISSTKNLVDFRFPVQTVIRPNLNFRGFAGSIASGNIRVGEEVQVLPSKQKANIKNIFSFDEKIEEASVSQSVVIELDKEIDVSRGDFLIRSTNSPYVSNCFEAMICWMNEKPLENKSYILKHTTRKVNAFISEIICNIDVNTLHRKQKKEIILNDIFKAKIETTNPIFFDVYSSNRATGSFILIDPDTNNTVAGGMIERKREHSSDIHLSGGIQIQSSAEGKVIWLTGLSGSGKTTIARNLFDLMQVKPIILDGDIIRKGLCKDLGFSLKDRKENIRRVAEVAKLCSLAGVNVIASFITPTNDLREMVSEILQDNFVEVYIKCPIEVCEKRDVKGLYKKARKNEIKLTGINSPFEEPKNAKIVVETDKMNILKATEIILDNI